MRICESMGVKQQSRQPVSWGSRANHTRVSTVLRIDVHFAHCIRSGWWRHRLLEGRSVNVITHLIPSDVVQLRCTYEDLGDVYCMHYQEVLPFCISQFYYPDWDALALGMTTGIRGAANHPLSGSFTRIKIATYITSHVIQQSCSKNR